MPGKERSRTVTFNRGLRTIISDYDQQRSFATLDNVWLDPDTRGAIGAMPGFVRVNSSEITGSPLRTIKSVKGNDDVVLRFVSSRNQLVRLDADGTVVAVKTGLTNNDHMGIEVLKNFALFFNEVDTPFKATIVASPVVTDIGVTRLDVSAVTVSPSSGGGSVVGTPKWYVAAMTGTVEGALSLPISHTTHFRASDNVTVALANIPLGAEGKAVLYRTYEFGGQPYILTRLTGTPGGTTTFNDTVVDSDLGDLPFLHGDPPAATFGAVVTYIDRVFALAGNQLYWSDKREPESWYVEANDGNFAWVYRDDGDNGVTIIRDLDGILIFKSDRLYKLVGRTPEEFNLIEVTYSDNGRRALGTPSQNSVVAVAGSGVAFYWNRRIWMYSGGVINAISTEISDQLRTIRRQDEQLGVALGYYSKRSQIWVSVPLSSGGDPTHTYIYDLLSRQWAGRMTVGFRGFAEVIDENGDEAFWGLSSASPAEGFVHALDSGVDHDGEAFTSTAELPVWYDKSPNDLKMFLSVDIHFVPQASGEFNVQVIIDGRTVKHIHAVVSQVQANTTRDRTRVSIGFLGGEITLKITSDKDQPLWNILAVTYNWMDEDVTVAR